MNTLPEDIQNTIYKFKHQMEFNHVINEMHDIVNFWCIDQLDDMYCKSRHEGIHERLRNKFKCLNDYEEHLWVDLTSTDILAMIND